MLSIVGKLSIAPERPDFKKTNKKDVVILELQGKGLSYYMINQLTNEYGPWLNLASPMYGCHLTLVGGFGTYNKSKLSKYAGKSFSFDVDLTTITKTSWSKDTNWGFWYVNAFNVQYIEKILELKIKSPHVTIAREDSKFSCSINMPSIRKLDSKKLISCLLDIIDKQHYQLWIELTRMLLVPTSVDDIIKLVYQNMSHPSKSWEFDLVNWLKLQ